MTHRCRSIFAGGTSSHAGKSWMTTAICAWLRRRGWRVAPFKAQNRSDNSLPCASGGEVGRAQVAPAETRGPALHPDFNPILLKPDSDQSSQVVENGRVRKTMTAGGLITGLILLTLTAAAQAPQRIVSTAPSATEILYALGLGPRVVGVTTYCHYPPEVESKPKIGTYLQPNFEAILAARPDLVIVVKNPVRLAERLQRMGLRVLELSEETLPGIYDSITRVAKQTGVTAAGQQLNRRIEIELRTIAAKTERLPKRTMMFIVSRSPGQIEGLMAVGRASYLNELIHIAGGRNIFDVTSASYPKVSLEEVLSRNPEVIVDMGDMAETRQVSEAHKRRVIELWRAHPSIAAVQRNAVFAVASDIFVVPGPRAVEAAQAFLQMLHPDVAP